MIGNEVAKLVGQKVGQIGKNAYLCSTYNVSVRQFILKPTSPACESRGFLVPLQRFQNKMIIMEIKKHCVSDEKMYRDIDPLTGEIRIEGKQESVWQKAERLQREKKERRQAMLKSTVNYIKTFFRYSWKIVGALCLLAGGIWSIIQVLLWMKVI